MHEGQLPTDEDLARRLIAEQFPAWADLAITAVDSDGTANAIYRLGENLALRLPVFWNEAKAEQLAKELEWLPRFAPVLPLALPEPMARGEPSGDYPAQWSVVAWMPGDTAQRERLNDPVAAAHALAGFIRALRAIDPTEGPAPGAHNFERGVPLAARAEFTAAMIGACEGCIDTAAVTAAWHTDLAAPVWGGAALWVHGDLAPGNLIAAQGRLAAVIDWGGLGVGDPAIDLLPAWNLFEGESRRAFRAALAVDEASWARGRGSALSQAIGALGYYRETNPAIVRWAQAMICEVLADHAAQA